MNQQIEEEGRENKGNDDQGVTFDPSVTEKQT